MIRSRLTREQQSGRNRDLVLAAARRVFLDRGYHGATLEQIADEAGFSKGVVYSQFGSKADLFFALLEARIDERAAANAKLAAQFSGSRGVAQMFSAASQVDGSDPAWVRLVIEFRVHAARNPELNARYAAAHERTIAGVAALVGDMYERAGEEPPLPVRELAHTMLALALGVTLERTANPAAMHEGLGGWVLYRLMRPTDGEEHA